MSTTAAIKTVAETVELTSGARISVTESKFSETGREFANITLFVDTTSKAARAQLIADKDAIVAALKAAGYRARKGDGLRYSGSQFTSVNTGVRYNFIACE